MTKTQLNPRVSLLLSIVILVGTARLINASCLNPLSNFTPIGAMGLFGGTYFSQRWKAFAFPLLTLLFSDLIINGMIYGGKYGIMYSGWMYNYAIFAGIVLLGKVLMKKVNLQNFLLSGVAASVGFWLLVDFGVWFGGGMDIRTGGPLSRDLNGLIQCYIQGYPYMLNFLAGTLGYGAVMFGAIEFAKIKLPNIAFEQV